MKIIKLITLVMILTVGQTVLAQDMGGPPPKKKKVTKSDINGEKNPYTKLQKKFQSKTVFSNSKIDKNNGTADQLINTWNMEKPLFYRIFYSQTIIEAVLEFNEKTKTKFNQYDYAEFATSTVVYINGKELANREVKFGSKDMVYKWTTASGYIYNPASSGKSSETFGIALRRAFHALGDDLKVGESYDVKFETYAFDYALDDTRNERDKSQRVVKISEGALKVNVTEKGLKTFAPFMCYEILKHKGDIVNDELEDKIMVEFSKTYGNATESNIVNEDWNIKKNNYGTPIKRVISTKVSYIDMKGKSNIMDYYINQPYDGSGGYQNVVKTSSVGESRPFAPYCVTYKKSQ